MTQKVGWICHHHLGDQVIGGAEQADTWMIERRPKNTEVTIIKPGGITKAIRHYDAIVVTRSEFLNERDIEILLKYSYPVVWAHGFQQLQAPHAKNLFEGCRAFIALTPPHLYEELKWLNLPLGSGYYNPGWMDVDVFPPLHMQGSENLAVWAARPEPHKGLDRAKKWVGENQVPMVVHTNSPRNEVIKDMTKAKYFVLLSHIFDAGPLSVIEAQLCGCELVLDNVGYYAGWSQERLREFISTRDKAFWEVVLR
jgi:glycosyltransferase involved in cell wall biosynthesis